MSLQTTINEMINKLNIAQENGLFQHQKDQYDTIHSRLLDALGASMKANCSATEYVAARKNVDDAQTNFNTTIQSAKFGYKFNYVYGLPVLLYLIGMLGLIAFREAFRSLFPPLSSVHLSLPAIPTHIVLAGAVGAILRAIIALWRQVDRMLYRRVWATWFILSPITGALLGGIVYLGFFVGILVTTNGMINNPALPILIAAIAGFNWEWAQGVLQNLANVFTVAKK